MKTVRERCECCKHNKVGTAHDHFKYRCCNYKKNKCIPLWDVKKCPLAERDIKE